MNKKIEITADEYEEFKCMKKLKIEAAEQYHILYQHILLMRLLVLAYFDNEADHHAYSSDDIFHLIFDACEEMYSSALNIHKIVYNCSDE